MTMLGPEYGQTASCQACDADCDNDMLLMSGYLCHPCLPNPCHHAQPCVNLIGTKANMQGYAQAQVRIVLKEETVWSISAGVTRSTDGVLSAQAHRRVTV